MKKKFNFRKFAKGVINVTLFGVIAYFGLRVVMTLIITPIISVYSSAYYLGLERGVDLMPYAVKFTKQWLIDLLFLTLAVLGFRVYKNRKVQDYGEQ